MRRDNRCDVLLADGQGDLRQKPAIFDLDYPADQLVAAADFPELVATQTNVPALQFFRNQPVDFAFRYAVMASRSFGRFDFAAVNPLLQCGIADSQNVRCFTRRQQPLHKNLTIMQYRIRESANSIRFYTIFDQLSVAAAGVLKFR